MATLHECMRALATEEGAPREEVVRTVVETVLREHLGRAAAGDLRFQQLVVDVTAAMEASEPLRPDLDVLREQLVSASAAAGLHMRSTKR